MSSSSRSGSTGRQSWRETRRQPQGSSAGKQVARWTLSLISLMLAAALTMLLLQGCSPEGNTHLAVLQVPYGAGSTPPLYFAAGDVDYLEQHVEERATQVHLADRGKWIALRESSSMHRLGENLAELQLAPEDRLLLYVSAHGITEGDQAYLLGSELDLKQSSGSAGALARYPLRDFLQQIADAPGALKLLILDWGRIPFDPRLGVAVNEFPRLLERAVQEINDPALWVLTSHSHVEPAVNFQAGYSVFARAVAEGLGGAADAHPQDRNVTLDELYGYVVARSDAWFYPDTTLVAQPQLLRGGTGRVMDLTSSRGLKLLRVRNMPPASESGEAAEGEEGGPAEKSVAGEIADRAATEFGRQLGSESRSILRRNAIISRSESVASRGRSDLDRLRRVLPPPAPESTPDAGAEATRRGEPGAEAPVLEGADPSSPPEETPSGTDSGPSLTAARQSPDLAQLLTESDLELEQLHETDQTILAVLLRLWWLRDELQQRQNPQQVSPLDFAPHRWRNLNARLLVAEQQFLAGSDPAELIESLLELVGECEELQGLLAGDAGRRSSGLTRSPGRWTTLWQQYRLSPEFADQRPDDALLREGIDAQRQLRSAAFRLPWYIQWQATELAMLNTLGSQREVSDQVSRCRAFQQLLESLAGSPLEEPSLQLIRDRRRQVVEGDRILMQSVARRLEDAEQAELSTVRQRRLATLLSTPLLEASPRCVALAQVLLPNEERPVTENWQIAPPATPRWQDVDESSKVLASLTWNMLELAGMHDQPATGTLDGTDAMRENAARMRTHFESLVSLSARETSPGMGNSPQSVHDGFQRLLFADPRDLLVDNVYPRSGLQPPTKPAKLFLAEMTPPVLAIDRWERVVLPIVADGSTGDELTVTLQFPADQIQLLDGNGTPPSSTSDVTRQIRPGQPLLVRRATGAADAGWELPLYVRALTTATVVAGEARLNVSLASTGVDSATELLNWSLPAPPNQVRLVARREGAGLEQELPAGLRLRPHPNRTTGFEFFLVNESLKPRKVTVTMLRAERAPASVRRAPGRFFEGVTFDDRIGRLMLTSDDRIRPDLLRTRNILTTAEPVMLTPDLEHVRIPLVSAAAPSVPDTASGEPAPPATPFAAVDLTDGLICVITDVERADEQWIHWLEIYPLAPRNYLQAQARYEAGRIYVSVSPADRNLAPVPLGEEKAIPIYLHSTEVNAEASQVAKIESADQAPVQVWIAAPQDEQPRTVWLDVDGVPRAFAFEIVCREGARGEDLRQRRWQIEIHQLATDPEAPQPVTRDRDRPMAFRENQTLWTDLRIDMPINAFEGFAHDDVIEIGLGEEQPLRFFSERATRTELSEVTGGTLLLKTVVTDHRVPLDIAGRRGEVRVGARARYRGSEERDLVPVILDGIPPRVSRLSFVGSTIPQGTKLTAQVVGEDMGSGVVSIRVGFDRNGNGELDEADQPLEVEQSFATVQLDTAELQIGKSYRVLAEAKDRVGLVSPLVQQDVMIIAPKMPEKEAAPTKGNIRGSVLFSGTAAVSRNLVTVSIEGSGIPPVRTGAGGSFEFRDVPAGTYTLQASGSFSNMPCVGEVKGVVVPSRQPVIIPVKRP